MHETASYISVAVGLLVTVLGGLIKAELRSMRSEFTAQLAAAEGRFFERVNGNYVRREVLDLKIANVTSRCEQCRHDFEPKGKLA